MKHKTLEDQQTTYLQPSRLQQFLGLSAKKLSIFSDLTILFTYSNTLNR